jgi:hypothetical protein
MQDTERRDAIIVDVCKAKAIDPQVVRDLLALEKEHPDLLGWGARPNLRRDIARIIDLALDRRRGE